MKGANCSFPVENKCRELMKKGAPKENRRDVHGVCHCGIGRDV